MGVDSSTRRPTCETILSMMRNRCWESRKLTVVSSNRPLRSMYTCLCVLTRMSEMVGSCSSGSSGPSPNTSSSTSSQICCFSSELSSVGSESISAMSAWRTSLRTRWLSIVARASRLILSTSLRCKVNFSSWYSGLSAPFDLPPFFRSRCSQLIWGADLVSRLGNIVILCYTAEGAAFRSEKAARLRSWSAPPDKRLARFSIALPSSQ